MNKVSYKFKTMGLKFREDVKSDFANVLNSFKDYIGYDDAYTQARNYQLDKDSKKINRIDKKITKIDNEITSLSSESNVSEEKLKLVKERIQYLKEKELEKQEKKKEIIESPFRFKTKVKFLNLLRTNARNSYNYNVCRKNMKKLRKSIKESNVNPEVYDTLVSNFKSLANTVLKPESFKNIPTDKLKIINHNIKLSSKDLSLFSDNYSLFVGDNNFMTCKIEKPEEIQIEGIRRV